MVELTINSCGGDARICLDVFDALAGKVATATIVERCCSSAVILALTAERIKIFQTARVLVHGPSLAVLGCAADLRQSASFLDTIRGQWLDVFSKRTKADATTVRSWLSGPDVWFSPDEALAAGLVDEIIPPAPQQATTDALDQTHLACNADVDDSSERLLFELLRALGRVETRDARRLFRDLEQWARINVREMPINLPVENRVLIRSCATGHGDGVGAKQSVRVDNLSAEGQ